MKKAFFLCFVFLACCKANAQEDRTINLRLEQPDGVVIAKPKIVELALVQPDEPMLGIAAFELGQELIESEPSVRIVSLDQDEVELLFSGFTASITLDIYDVWGQFLKTEKVANYSDNQSYKTALPKTVSRIYILRTKSRDFQSTHKILTKQ